jgi:hypothetical protein
MSFDRRGPIPPVARDKPLIGPRNRPENFLHLVAANALKLSFEEIRDKSFRA